MTAKEYLMSLTDRKEIYSNLSEKRCLEKLIESHKRIRGHYFYHLAEFKAPLDKLADGVAKIYNEITEI